MQKVCVSFLLCLTYFFPSTLPADVEVCSPHSSLAVQVLGSGGPIADDSRASSGYVLWVDGRSRVLVDAGGGVFLRFGESGAQFKDLDFVGISHLHTDHSSDIPALLKSGYFSIRERPLHVAGPGASGHFPGLNDWLLRMLGSSSGAYAYLNGYLDGSDGMAQLSLTEVTGEVVVPIELKYRQDPTLTVHAMPVPHGIVPALAFRIESRNHVVVFGGDQTGANQAFTGFAHNADLLIMHMAIPEKADPVARKLHATPRAIGEIARSVRPGRLLLSHLMSRSLRTIDESLSIIGQYYPGEILVAEDLMCLELDLD
jgi:ribonuclease BN (tRNA processing enzyme)